MKHIWLRIVERSVFAVVVDKSVKPLVLLLKIKSNNPTLVINGCGTRVKYTGKIQVNVIESVIEKPVSTTVISIKANDDSLTVNVPYA